MNQPHADWVSGGRVAASDWTPLADVHEAARCGGKAASLGRMLRAGLPVPDGGVIDVDVLQTFLATTGLGERIDVLLAESNSAGPPELTSIETAVRAAFAETKWPESIKPLLDRIASYLPAGSVWAVRSSAVGEDDQRASCAGIMDSVLGVGCGASLEQAIKRVWASRWSARALAYERTGHGSLGSMAVVVQRQIEPWIAGVAFSRSPEPQRADEILCEYFAGLADGLVSGEIDPARLRLARSDGTVLTSELVEGVPALDEGVRRKLVDAALATENLFGGPQDIEFAVDRAGKLWLVQSRPITAGMRSPAGRRIVWSNANVNENFPDPISPLLYSVAGPGYSAYFGNLGRAFGLAKSRLARMEKDLAGIVGVHGGRLYYNLTAIHSVLSQAPFGDRLCAWFDEFTGAADPTQSSPRNPHGFVRGLRDAIELVWIAARTTWQYLFIGRRVRTFEARIDAYASAAKPEHLSALSRLALRDLLRSFLDIRLRHWTDASLADAAAMVCYGLLKALVRRVAGDAEANATHNDLLKGLTGLKSAEPVDELWRLAQAVRNDPGLCPLFEQYRGDELLVRLRGGGRHAAFVDRFDRWLETWGFRCSGELMLTVPSFQERPAELLDIVRNYAAQIETAPGERLEQQRVQREAATARLLTAARRHALVGRLPWPSLAPVLRCVLSATQASIGLRERARLKQALLYSRLRRVALEIGCRLTSAGSLAAPDDVFFLAVSELDHLLSGQAMYPGEVRALAALRRAAHQRFAAMHPADVLVASEGEYPDPVPDDTRQVPAGEGLCGVSVCGGVVTGKAKVLVDVAQTHSLMRGDVLVTRQTDPGWAPAFATIAGLVLERGGMLSHGAILAREYGIPTVVGVRAATERIVTGSIVRVDGDRGEVQRVDA
ncbi:PEP/pyruvate-binding domain-containing protein [Accumulibacter sp.]|uniref:PEP/pyruvate-binding domain-containing protein n=1 Tax=Accumulibacter sp. TaxID=2053492 RepID=UPI00260FD5DA|nr:PEP/pyruvate-binding domain-containing protein [Accumulibacter sp.]